MNIKKILDDHLLWLKGQGGERANLSGADLRGADLNGADLSEAIINTIPILRGYFGQHSCYATKDIIRIGCKEMTHADWLKKYKEIGKQENYSDFETKMYGAFIKMAVAWQKRI